MSKYDGEIIEKTINKSLEKVTSLFSDKRAKDYPPINMVNKPITFKQEIVNKGRGALDNMNLDLKNIPRFSKCICGYISNEYNKCPKCGSEYSMLIREEEDKVEFNFKLQEIDSSINNLIEKKCNIIKNYLMKFIDENKYYNDRYDSYSNLYIDRNTMYGYQISKYSLNKESNPTVIIRNLLEEKDIEAIVGRIAPSLPENYQIKGLELGKITLDTIMEYIEGNTKHSYKYLMFNDCYTFNIVITDENEGYLVLSEEGFKLSLKDLKSKCEDIYRTSYDSVFGDNDSSYGEVVITHIEDVKGNIYKHINNVTESSKYDKININLRQEV